MIELNLHLLKDFDYFAHNMSFPFVAELLSSETIELATKMNVRELTLTPIEAQSEDDFFGTLRRSGMGMPGTVFELSSQRSSFFAFDVLEGQTENLEEFVKGRYKLRMVVDVFEKDGSSFQCHTLDSEKIVSVN